MNKADTKFKRDEGLSATKKVAGEEAYRKQNTSDEDIRTHAVQEVLKTHSESPLQNTELFIRRVADKFVQSKLHNFPKLCQETRRVNWLKRKELRAMGNEKGWSNNKTMMVDYDIPRELYMFMTNMVYREFWAEKNEKIWRSFMKGIMRGDDPQGLLNKVIVHYQGVKELINMK